MSPAAAGRILGYSVIGSPTFAIESPV
jgi:hypothetical protein